MTYGLASKALEIDGVRENFVAAPDQDSIARDLGGCAYVRRFSTRGSSDSFCNSMLFRASSSNTCSALIFFDERDEQSLPRPFLCYQYSCKWSGMS